MRKDIICPICNRGIWLERTILVTVGDNDSLIILPITGLDCFFCGRQMIYDPVTRKITPARGPDAMKVIESAIEESWYSKIPKTKETKDVGSTGYGC